MYQGLSRLNFRSRLRWTASGTARSVWRNGLPGICRIITNVRKITTRMTGIVQKIRLTMNLSMAASIYPRRIVNERGRGSRPVRVLCRVLPYSVTTTFVRSVWFSRLTLKDSLMFSRSRFVYV